MSSSGGSSGGGGLPVYNDPGAAVQVTGQSVYLNAAAGIMSLVSGYLASGALNFLGLTVGAPNTTGLAPGAVAVDQTTPGLWFLTVTGIPDTWVNLLAGGYDSLTGTGKTATPGALTQTGDLTVKPDTSGMLIADQAGNLPDLLLLRVKDAWGVGSTTPIDVHDAGNNSAFTVDSQGQVTIRACLAANVVALTILNSLNTPMFTVDAHGHVVIQSTDGTGLLVVKDVDGAKGLEILPGAAVGLFGASPVGQAVAITPPSGGAVVDVQSRAAIVAILDVIGAAAGGIGITA